MSVISILIAVAFVLALVFVFGTLWALIIGIAALGYLFWYVDGWIRAKRTNELRGKV